MIPIRRAGNAHRVGLQDHPQVGPRKIERTTSGVKLRVAFGPSGGAAVIFTSMVWLAELSTSVAVTPGGGVKVVMAANRRCRQWCRRS